MRIAQLSRTTKETDVHVTLIRRALDFLTIC